MTKYNLFEVGDKYAFAEAELHDETDNFLILKDTRGQYYYITKDTMQCHNGHRGLITAEEVG